MPATFSTLRVDELLLVTAHPVNQLGQVDELTGAAFEITSPAAGAWQIVSGQTDSLQALISGVAPGLDVLEFSGSDSLSNGVFAADQPITVLDAAGFRFVVSGASDCALIDDRSGTLIVDLATDPVGDPYFFLRMIPVDIRVAERGVMPVYALADGPNLFMEHGRAIFGPPFNSQTANDANVVKVTVTARGEETVHAFAVTDATGVLISGEFPMIFLTASSVTLTAEPA